MKVQRLLELILLYECMNSCSKLNFILGKKGRIFPTRPSAVCGRYPVREAIRAEAAVLLGFKFSL